MAEPNDLAYSVLPTDAVGLYAEDNLRLAAEEALMSGVDLVSTLEVDEDAVEPLGRGWAFDFDTGQFVRHGATPARVSGQSQLQMWIEKTLYTAKQAHPIYSDTYGMSPPLQDFIASDRPGSHQVIESAIISALRQHDHIQNVTDFSFDYKDEYVLVNFSVVLSGGTAFTVPVNLRVL